MTDKYLYPTQLKMSYSNTNKIHLHSHILFHKKINSENNPGKYQHYTSN
jgi:hypothetical protein